MQGGSAYNNARPMMMTTAGGPQGWGGSMRYINQNVRKANRSVWCFPGCGCCWAFIALLIAMGCFFSGQDMLEIAEDMSPEREFKFLGRDACSFDRISHFESEEDVCVRRNSGEDNSCREYKTACFDTYAYFFTWNSTGTKEYAAGSDNKLQRPGEPYPCSYNRPKAEPRWEVNQTTSCWRPANGIEVNEIPEEYNCKNPECIKVVDPADEVDNLKAAAMVLIIVGQSLFAFTGLLCCCCVITATRAAQGKRI